jgi:hypothetical protein
MGGDHGVDLGMVATTDAVVGDGPRVLAELKEDPGQFGLETLLREVGKLRRVRAIRLPPELFADASEKLIAAWRARAARMYPSDFRAAPRPVRLTLLACLCWQRTAELTDGLVDLLIALVHKIDARAEHRVERELLAEPHRVRGKEGILFGLAEAPLTWVVGANRWRDPEQDLPQDFDANHDMHYAAIRQPLDPATFIEGLRQRLGAALGRLDRALGDGSAGGVRVTTRRGEPWVTVPPMDKQPEPPTLQALKDEVERRWGTIDLLDLLKDADYLTGFSEEFASVASREITNRALLRKRLLLVLFALGTNMGVRRVVAAGANQHGETEATLRRVRRLYVNRDNLRRAITRLVNATFAVRDTGLWGAGTACASDSKKFGSWQSNLMTEWHNRYLFEPFQRPDRTRVDDHHGLGLSIVRAIAITHDATLTANVRAQGGRSIEIQSPLIPFAMPRWAASETLERPASGRRTRRSGWPRRCRPSTPRRG